MKTLWAKTAVAALAAVWTATVVAAAPTPEQQIAKFYPKYSAQYRCRIAHDQDGDYCMKANRQQVVQTAQGKMLYVLWTGDYIDLETGGEGGHVSQGMAGLFAFRENGKGWQLVSAEPKYGIGSWGRAPDDWNLHEFGAGTWGWLTDTGYLGQGTLVESYIVLLPQGRRFAASTLGKGYDNAGYFGDCDDWGETAAERRDCRARSRSLDTQLKIRRDLPASSGIYPLELKLSGNDGGRKFRNQSYLIHFSPAKKRYIEPKNYPLRDTHG